MKGSGIIIFKSIENRDGGKFVNDRGQEIKYQSCYILKADEIVNGKIYDLRFKILEENKTLINNLKTLESYTKIDIKFDVDCSGSFVRIVPTDFTVVK